MAISPPGDLVLDVLRAADPGRSRAARARLGAEPGADPFPSKVAAPRAPTTVERHAPTAVLRPPPDPYRALEAFLLRGMIETMMPAASPGPSKGGEVWRSFLAEHLADAVAAGGGIGVARTLARHADAMPVPRSGA